KERAEDPLRPTDCAVPKLVVLDSPYRDVITPIVEYVLNLQKANPSRCIAVVVPELVERKWYHFFLHNQRAEWLKASLLLKGNPRILVVNVPWYLRPGDASGGSDSAPDPHVASPGA